MEVGFGKEGGRDGAVGTTAEPGNGIMPQKNSNANKRAPEHVVGSQVWAHLLVMAA